MADDPTAPEVNSSRFRWWEAEWVETGFWSKVRWSIAVGLLLASILVLACEILIPSASSSSTWRDLGFLQSSLSLSAIGWLLVMIGYFPSTAAIGIGANGLAAASWLGQREYPWGKIHFVAPRKISLPNGGTLLLTAHQAERLSAYFRDHPGAT